MKTVTTMLQTIRRSLLAQAAVACVLPMTMSATNLLSNPGFETNTPGVAPGTPVVSTACGGGISAAVYWRVWMNSCGSNMLTTLIPSTAPNGGQYMMHVQTAGANNGLYVNFSSNPKTVAYIWLYINSGCVGIGTGNFAETGDTDEMTCVTGKWIQLYQVPNAVSPGNEFVIYSVMNPVFGGTGGADFYVDNAEVDAAQ